MPVSLPIVLALALLMSSLLAGWDRPLRVERADLRMGHAIANNSNDQPSGFQLTHALPAVDVPLTRPFGPSWMRGRIVWNPELQVGLFSVPNVRPLFGIHPVQFRYELEPVGRWSLYGLSGFGGVYSNIERQETGSDGNLSIIVGAGFRCTMTRRTSWVLEYRHLHMSNISSDDQNSGIDAHTALVGVSVRL